MENNKVTEQAPASAGTQETPTPPASDTQNAETTSKPEQNETKYVPSDPDKNVTAAKPPIDENEFKAVSGKISKLEKENAELAKKAADTETLRQAFSLYEEELKTSPEAFNKFASKWKDKTGRDIGTYQQYYGTTQSPPSSGPVDVKQIADIARREAQQQFARETENRDAVNIFLNKHPEMDWTKAPDDAERQRRQEIFGKVAELAVINEGYFKDKLGKNLGETIIHFYETLPENLSAMQQQAQQTGAIMGRQDALAKGVGVSGGVQGTGGQGLANTVEVPLSPELRERYEYWKARDPKFAERLLKRYAQG